MANDPKKAKVKKTCDGCGGSGQISFFRGVSRFVMDWDDCPDCLGTGYIDEPSPTPKTAPQIKKRHENN